MTYHARVTATGEVIFPADLAAELKLQPGSSLTIEREDGKLVLKSFDQVVRDAQAEFNACCLQAIPAVSSTSCSPSVATRRDGKMPSTRNGCGSSERDEPVRHRCFGGACDLAR